MKTDEIYNHVNHDSELFRVLKCLPKIGPNGPWLAGGSVWKAIENRPIEYDLDFFFSNPMQFQMWTRLLKSIPYVHHIVKEKKSKYNVSYQFHVSVGKYNKTITIQGVNFKYWKNAEELLDGFDFTACQFAMDGRTIYVGDTSFEDLKARSIRFHKIHDSYATKVHLDKYIQEGFVISGDQQKRYEELVNEAHKVKKAPAPATTVRAGNTLFRYVNDTATIDGATMRMTREPMTDVDNEYPQPATVNQTGNILNNINIQAMDDFDVDHVVEVRPPATVQPVRPAPAPTMEEVAVRFGARFDWPRR